MKNLSVYTTLAVLVHAVIVVWHLFVLAKIPPGLTGQQVLGASYLPARHASRIDPLQALREE